MTVQLLKRRKELIVGSLLFFVIAVGVYYLLSWQEKKKDLLSSVDARLILAAETIPLLLEPDFHDRALSPDSISLKEELRNRKYFNTFVDFSGLIYAQTIVKQGDVFYFSAPTVTEKEAIERESWYFHPYDDIPAEFREAYITGQTVYLDYRDQWGAYRSICRPQVSEGGRRYLVVADISMESVYAELKKAKASPIATALFILLLVSPLVYSLMKLMADLGTINADLKNAKQRLEKRVGVQQSQIANTELALNKNRGKLVLFQSLNQQSLSGIIVFDREENILEVNKTALKMLAPGRETPSELKISSIWGKDFVESNLLSVKSGQFKHTQNNITEYSIKNCYGTPMTVMARVGILHVGKEKEPRFFISFYDVTEVKKNQDKLDYIAHHDPSTALLNREGLLLRMKEMVEQRNCAPAVLVFVVRDFKRINEALGTDVGDEVLCAIARRLKEVLLHGEELARLGGVEFAVALNEIAYEGAGLRAAERFLNVLKAPFLAGESEFYLSGNIGITLLQYDRTPEKNLSDAVIAAVEAKRTGRGRILFYDAKLQARSIQAIELESLLHSAILQKSFTVYFQPIVDIQSGKISGVEALARWFLQDGRSVSPADFIPLAETTGLIHPLSEILFALSGEGFLQLRQADPSLYLSLNISPALLEDNTVEKLLILFLEKTGIDPQDVVLEITETSFIADLENCRAALERLVARGYWIAIDDFGVGNSSISYLQNFPIKKLKIDQSFVRSIAAPDADWTLIRGILSMSEVLRIGVVAEGVETPRQEELLKELRCPQGQGYLYYRPMDVQTCFAALRASCASKGIDRTEYEG